MQADMQLLRDIQEIDQEILELNSQLARYPQLWEEVKGRVNKAREAFERAEKAQERHQRERRSVEQKIRLFTEDLRHSQVQQATIKTQREYEAVNKQIESLKSKLSLLEEKGLELINRDEDVNNAVAQAREGMDRAQDFYKSEKGRIREQFNEKKERVAALEQDKKKLVPRVNESVYADYQRIFKSHPGSVVVPVRGGSCGGCHFGLVPNDLLQLHRAERMVFCPNCNRILSHDEDFQPAEHASASGSVAN